MVPVCNVPTIARTIHYLVDFGVTEIAVNAYHLHQRLVEYLKEGSSFGIPIEVFIEREILGTGGGIENTRGFWDKGPFVVINGDIVTSIDLCSALKAHEKSGTIATLVLHDFQPFNKIRLDEGNCISQIPRELPRPAAGTLAFTGIHIVEPELLQHIPRGTRSDIMDCYRSLISEGSAISGHLAEGHFWYDIGTIEGYVNANLGLLGNEHLAMGCGVRIHPTARIGDWAVVGNHCSIEEGAQVTRSILWEHIKIRRGVRVNDSIVTEAGEVLTDLSGAII
jgi:NDP-sugar pyrophosphorylase family protein